MSLHITPQFKDMVFHIYSLAMIERVGTTFHLSYPRIKKQSQECEEAEYEVWSLVGRSNIVQHAVTLAIFTLTKAIIKRQSEIICRESSANSERRNVRCQNILQRQIMLDKKLLSDKRCEIILEEGYLNPAGLGFGFMDPRSHGWIHSGQGFIGSFDAPWSVWSRITNPNPDHTKNYAPLVVELWWRWIRKNRTYRSFYK